MPAPHNVFARAERPRKPTLSPTKIATYLECAVKYRYIYLDKIGRFYLRARSYYSFGSTLHQVLQEFHEQGATQTPEELVTQVAQVWIGAGYQSAEQEQEHRALGEQIVQSYHAAHQERIEAQVETIATEKTITCDLGDFKLSGRIDRLDRHPDGTLEVIDYKSGRWETTPEEVADDLAMRCYLLILRNLYPDTPLRATIYCLRSGITASAELTALELDAFERDLRLLGKEILERDYMELEPTWLDICPRCDFLPRCERFWRAQAQIEKGEATPHSEDGL